MRDVFNLDLAHAKDPDEEFPVATEIVYEKVDLSSQVCGRAGVKYF